MVETKACDSQFKGSLLLKSREAVTGRYRNLTISLKLNTFRAEPFLVPTCDIAWEVSNTRLLATHSVSNSGGNNSGPFTDVSETLHASD